MVALNRRGNDGKRDVFVFTIGIAVPVAPSNEMIFAGGGTACDSGTAADPGALSFADMPTVTAACTLCIKNTPTMIMAITTVIAPRGKRKRPYMRWTGDMMDYIYI